MRVGDVRRLGRSRVEVTAPAFGGAPIGGLYAPVSEEVAAATAARALSRGLRYFDTAPHYGAGTSERRLGAVLRPSGAVVSTKVGRLLRPRAPGEEPDDEGFAGEPPLKRVWDFSADGVRRSLEGALDRLGLDRVDVVFIQDPDFHEDRVYTEAARLREVCAAHGVPLRAAALQFPMRHPAVASVLVGCRTPAEVDDNAAMFELEIPDALWEAL